MSINGKQENITYEPGDEVITNLVPFGEQLGIVKYPVAHTKDTVIVDFPNANQHGVMIETKYLKHTTVSYMKRFKEGVKPTK